MPTSENWVMLAAGLGTFTAVTTRRTISYALVVDTPPLVTLDPTNVASCTHVLPPSAEPNSTAVATSDVRVYDWALNGSGNRSCTHSPATPAVVAVPA